MDKISKAQVKLVRSLQQKKFRDELGLFVAEGEKCVEELRKGFELEYRIQSTDYRPNQSVLCQAEPVRTLSATRSELEQMSGLRTPQGVIGVFKKAVSASGLSGETIVPFAGKEAGLCSVSPKDGLVLALDGIQDPGNLGTIIRTCDWFGVHDIFCSRDTADCYNPKVVQATMGALARVRLHYVDLPEWIEGIKNQESGIRIYGTLLDGKNMYEVLQQSVSPKDGLSASAVCQQNGLSAQQSVIIMGNEGNGISEAVRKMVTQPIRIPSYPNKEASDVVESLNVSVATAIVLAAFRQLN